MGTNIYRAYGGDHVGKFYSRGRDVKPGFIWAMPPRTHQLSGHRWFKAETGDRISRRELDDMLSMSLQDLAEIGKDFS